MASCAFSRLDIWHMARGGTEICWLLSQNFHFPVNEEPHFYVDYGNAGTDTWIALNEEPVIGACCFTDPCQRNWEFLHDGFYRVRMIFPSQPDVVYTSFPEEASGTLSKKDWLIAREIIRKELLQQTKIDGTQGFLLKRKKFGVACSNPDCLEWDTREITDSNCPICYGTGLVGGYYPGIPHYLTFTPGVKSPRRIDAGKPPRGVSSDILDDARSILYPNIDTRDVWVNAGSDERYVVDGYDCIADIKTFELVGTLHLKLAPATDVVYSVPIEGTPPLEEPPVSEQPDGVRKGLNATYEDW